MTLSQFENGISFSQTSLGSQDQVNDKGSSALNRFDSTLKKYFIFHAAFFMLAFSQIILFIYFFNSISQLALISVTLSGIFLTLFSYFILRAYWQTTKAQQLLEIKNDLIDELKTIFEYQEDLAECQISMSNALCKMAQSVIGKEYSYFMPPKGLVFTEGLLEKLSYWGYWKDCHQFMEMLLTSAVDEQIKLVKNEPTNPDTHTSLANTYILLTGLYALEHSQEDIDGFWGPSFKEREDMNYKFRIASERAIEELKILSNFAPNDPWIHEQLAYSYRDLQMPAEEIQEYELILRLMPNNAEIMYKLGVLYFEQGKNSLGLHLYEELRHTHYKKALLLIEHYGAYKPFS